MNINIKKTALLFASLLILASCKIREDYDRKTDVVEEKLFRTDELPTDSSSIADISWKEFFTDAVLQKHIEKALENNLDVRMAIQSIISAESYLKQSKNQYFPTLSVGPGYSFTTSSLNTQFGQIIGQRTYINQFDITASISWEADIWGKLRSQEKAQMASYLSSVAGHRAVKSSLVASVASAYYQLLALDEQKKTINETIVLRKKNLETTKALKDAGSLTEVAVQQSEALVYNAESSLIDIETQIQILENSISLLQGIPSQTVERTNLSQQILPNKLQLGYSAKLLANRPDVMQAEYNLMQTYELTNAAKAAFYPSLTLTGSGGVQGIDVDKLFSAQSLFASVVAGLTQPVFNKRQIRTAYEVSLANRETAYLNFRKALLTAGKEVSDALRTYRVQDDFIALKQREADAYRKSVEYSQELVNYGMANYLEVITASVNHLNAELSIVNAKYSKMNAGIQLYQALGGGWK
ncbi:MAG: efflux transporter outer membrane subunit [Cruoricaptor ignavus]|nr:efflux transporter outer membrane subunit [Cruoricaptor ignavus]